MIGWHSAWTSDSSPAPPLAATRTSSNESPSVPPAARRARTHSWPPGRQETASDQKGRWPASHSVPSTADQPILPARQYGALGFKCEKLHIPASHSAASKSIDQVHGFPAPNHSSSRGAQRRTASAHSIRPARTVALAGHGQRAPPLFQSDPSDFSLALRCSLYALRPPPEPSGLQIPTSLCLLFSPCHPVLAVNALRCSLPRPERRARSSTRQKFACNFGGRSVDRCAAR